MKKAIIISVFVLTFVLYFRIVDNGFHSDDYWFFRDSSFSELQTSFQEKGRFRPLLLLEIYALNKLFGANLFAYALLHLMAISLLTVTIIFLVHQFVKEYTIAIISGLFFLIHPNNGEIFFWVSGIVAVMGMVFVLLSFLMYLNGRKYLSLVFFCFALGHYELGLFVPFVIALYLLLTHVFSSGQVSFHHIKSFLISFRGILPYFIILGIFILLALQFSTIEENVFRTSEETQGFSNRIVYTFMQYERYAYYIIQIFLIKDQKMIVLLLSLLIGLDIVFIFKDKKYRMPLLFFSLSTVFFYVPYITRVGYAFRYGSFGLIMFIPLVILLLHLFLSEAVQLISRFHHTSFGRKPVSLILLVLILLPLAAGNLRESYRIEKDWESTGDLCEDILAKFTRDYPNPPEGKIVFLNIPSHRRRALAFISFFDLALSDRYKYMNRVKPTKEIAFYPGIPDSRILLEDHPDAQWLFLWKGKEFVLLKRPIGLNGSREF